MNNKKAGDEAVWDGAKVEDLLEQRNTKKEFEAVPHSPVPKRKVKPIMTST